MMKSKVDKIINVFVKTVQELECEATKLNTKAKEKHVQATILRDEATDLECEAGRAFGIAKKIGELMNA